MKNIHKAPDYTTQQDYDPPHANWHDVTRIGSPYDEQIDIAKEGHWRHRKAMTLGPWVKGQAPSSGSGK